MDVKVRFVEEHVRGVKTLMGRLQVEDEALYLIVRTVNGPGAYVACIRPDGRLHLAPDLPPEFGLDLDERRRIRLADEETRR